MAGATAVRRSGLSGFEAQTVAAARAALADAPARDVTIGGLPVRLRFSPPLEPLLAPAFAVHPPAAEPPRLELLAVDDATAGGPPPRPPWGHGDYLPGDAIRGHDHAAYNLRYGLLSLLEGETGVYWVRDVALLPRWEVTHPLRALLHWGHPLAFAHGAPVGTGGRGVLLAGAGGSGKSTTALAAHAAGFAIGGDDYCLVATDPPAAHALYGLAKLLPGVPTTLPRVELPVETDMTTIRIETTPRLPIDALVLPRLTPGGGTRLRPASAADALLALGPHTAFQLPGARSLDTLTELVRAVPAYHLDLDGDGAVAALAELLC